MEWLTETIRNVTTLSLLHFYNINLELSYAETIMKTIMEHIDLLCQVFWEQGQALLDIYSSTLELRGELLRSRSDMYENTMKEKVHRWIDEFDLLTLL